jgi:Protein of unknown function (DUF3592)
VKEQYLGYAFICIGMLLPAAAVYALVREGTEQRWVKVVGRIITSRVDYDGELYRAGVHFSYRYNGIEYSAKTIRTFGLMYNFRGPAETTCARYPVGANVDVFVDPDGPERAVLEPGGDGLFVPMTFVASLFLIILGFYLVK